MKHLQVDDNLKNTVVVKIDDMEDYNHPVPDVSGDHVAHLLLSFQRNGLDTTIGQISVRLNPLNSNGHGPNTEICNKGKNLPVLEKTLTVDVVDAHHLLTVLRQLQT